MARLRPASRFVCLAALCTAGVALGAPQLSDADQTAYREYDLAKPEILRLSQMGDAELMRAIAHPTDPPSKALDAQMKSASKKGPALGDVSVPLHLRLVERKRLQLIDTVTWVRSPAIHCDDVNFDPAQLLDAKFQRHELASLACRRHAIDYVQANISRTRKADVASLLELKMPPMIEQQMLALTRDSDERQAVGLTSIFRRRLHAIQAIEDLFTYMQAHPAHLFANEIEFDNVADRPEGEKVYGRFMEAMQTAD